MNTGIQVATFGRHGWLARHWYCLKHWTTCVLVCECVWWWGVERGHGERIRHVVIWLGRMRATHFDKHWQPHTCRCGRPRRPRRPTPPTPPTYPIVCFLTRRSGCWAFGGDSCQCEWIVVGGGGGGGGGAVVVNLQGAGGGGYATLNRVIRTSHNGLFV